MFGQVLLVAVAVAVTALSDGALAGVPGSLLGGAGAASGRMAAAGAAGRDATANAIAHISAFNTPHGGAPISRALHSRSVAVAGA
jgi:hypothetical protein